MDSDSAELVTGVFLTHFMPRRRSKSKAGPSKPRSVDRAQSKIKKWNKVSDIPLDEEDGCKLQYPMCCLD